MSGVFHSSSFAIFSTFSMVSFSKIIVFFVVSIFLSPLGYLVCFYFICQNPLDLFNLT